MEVPDLGDSPHPTYEAETLDIRLTAVSERIIEVNSNSNEFDRIVPKRISGPP